jgi:hypothetical protein
MSPRAVLFCAACLFSAADGFAADIPRAIVCNFPGGNFASIESGRFVSKSVDDRMALTYGAIDPSTGTAQMIGNVGSADVLLLAEKSSLHFLERTGAGNLTITTVYLRGDARSFSAVHSRHVGTSKDPLVSQYLGSCDVR